MNFILPRDRGALRLGRIPQGRLRKRKHPIKWPWLAQIVLIDHSTLHYELHVLQLFYVFQRVAADGYDVRPLAGFDGSQLVPPAEQISGSRSARTDRLQRRHAILHVVLKFFRLVYTFQSKPPASVPSAIFTPFLMAFGKFSRCTSAIFGQLPLRPGATYTPTVIVGTQ